MVIAMKVVVKRLHVFEIPCFMIHAVLFQAASKIMINNFRVYLKVVVDRARRIFSTFPTIHYVASIAMPVQWEKPQK